MCDDFVNLISLLRDYCRAAYVLFLAYEEQATVKGGRKLRDEKKSWQISYRSDSMCFSYVNLFEINHFL